MEKIKGLLWGFGTLAIMISISLFISAWSYQSWYEAYKTQGTKVEGKITGKQSRRSGKSTFYEVGVSYFEGDILKEGELHLETVSVSGKLWEQLADDQTVTILFLKEKPEEPILELSTFPENQGFDEKYSSAWITVFTGILMLVIGFGLHFFAKKKKV